MFHSKKANKGAGKKASRKAPKAGEQSEGNIGGKAPEAGGIMLQKAGGGKDIVDKFANDRNAIHNADGKEPAPAPVMLEADAGASEEVLDGYFAPSFAPSTTMVGCLPPRPVCSSCSFPPIDDCFPRKAKRRGAGETERGWR